MLQSHDARIGQPAGDPWPESTCAEIDAAVSLAASIAATYAATLPSVRADLLKGLADALEDARSELVLLADRETALGLARLHGELDRTTFQLRGFAQVLLEGLANTVVDDAALPGPAPVGRPRLTRVRVPIGPVAMFSASNFPFAFSVLGGDTASALAAGFPVVVKGHPAHPKLSRSVWDIAQRVVAAQNLSPGVLQFVEGGSIEVGVHLVRAPAIAAVAFTGSFQGGNALAKLAAQRRRPIPLYGELGSINPLIVLPAALEQQQDVDALAQTLAASMCLASGQFCTSPGLLVVQHGAAGDGFIEALADALGAQAPHAMLSAGIRRAFEHAVAERRGHGRLKLLLNNGDGSGDEPKPFLAEVQLGDFLADHRLHDEVFGPAALVVRVGSIAETVALLRAIGGSLTVTLWGMPAGVVAPPADMQQLVQAATQIAGRVLFSGVPTGVAVAAAQHHGGPFPASTAPFTTSVGYAAMDRFLRPMALQDAPEWLVTQILEV